MASDIKPFREEWLDGRRGNFLALITPTLAAELMSRNTNNRGIKKRKIANYARDMVAGNWNADASDIKFDKDGVLLDGQNRLLACIEADAPFPTLIRTGLDPSARDHVDTGAARTTGDAFRMHGVVDQYNIAAAVSLRNRWDALVEQQLPISRGYNVVPAMTHQESLDYLAEHPSLEKMRGVGQAIHSNIARGLPRSVLMAFTSMIGEVDEGDARHFATRLIVGETSGTGDPVWAFTRYLALAQAPKVAGNRDRNSAMRHLLAGVKAWSAYRAHATVDKIAVSEHDKVVPLT